jgi:preprotein translocase subunit SecG
MSFLITILPYLQLSVAVLLIASILLQQTGAGIGEVFGGSGGDVGFHTRRGSERTLFRLSIVLAILFFILSLIAVFAG